MDKLKEIIGIFDIKLGDNLNFSDDKYIKKSMLSFEVKRSPESYKYFKESIVNINPINKKIFNIYSVYNVSDNESIINIYEEIKNKLKDIYDSSLIQLSLYDNFVIYSDNKAIVLSLNKQQNKLTLEATDYITLQNCYSLFAY